jgi:hypothetical protein
LLYKYQSGKKSSVFVRTAKVNDIVGIISSNIANDRGPSVYLFGDGDEQRSSRRIFDSDHVAQMRWETLLASRFSVSVIYMYVCMHNGFVVRYQWNKYKIPSSDAAPSTLGM